MEDYKNLVNDDKHQIDEPPQYPGPQYPGPQYPGPQYPGSTNTFTMAQSVPQVSQIIRSPEDLNVITSIKTKAILSLVLSIVFSLLSLLCFWPSLFCTIPAIVYAILALTGIDTNIYNAAHHAKIAAILTGVAIGSTVILTLIIVIFISIYAGTSGY